MYYECLLVVKEHLIKSKKNKTTSSSALHAQCQHSRESYRQLQEPLCRWFIHLGPRVPLHLWCRLMPFASTTLNLLRSSMMNPRLSIEECLHGVFDCNKTSIVPPGCKVVVHDATTNRGAWSTHGSDGWCLCMAPHHCRCHSIHGRKTRPERIIKSLRGFPHKINTPKMPQRKNPRSIPQVKQSP